MGSKYVFPLVLFTKDLSLIQLCLSSCNTILLLALFLTSILSLVRASLQHKSSGLNRRFIDIRDLKGAKEWKNSRTGNRHSSRCKGWGTLYLFRMRETVKSVRGYYLCLSVWSFLFRCKAASLNFYIENKLTVIPHLRKGLLSRTWYLNDCSMEETFLLVSLLRDFSLVFNISKHNCCFLKETHS